MKILHDNLLILPKAKETMTKSGIQLMADTNERPEEGTVYLVGTEVKEKDLKEGVRVMFKKYVSDTVKILNNTEYLVVREKDIMLIIDEDEQAEGVGYGRTSDIEMHQEDTLQPFDPVTKKPNPDFVKRYGEEALNNAEEYLKNPNKFKKKS